MSKKNRNSGLNKAFTKIVLLLLALCACFFVAGVGLSFSLVNYDQTIRNHIITLYSASVGSFLALLGVFLTIISGKGTEAEKRMLSYIPEFFLPDRYDLAKATNYHIGPEAEAYLVIPNYKVYVQNTDKTEFIIERVIVSSGENETLLTDSVNFYINKGSLFCLSFFVKEKANIVIIETKSIDEQAYCYMVDLNKRIIEKKIK